MPCKFFFIKGILIGREIFAIFLATRIKGSLDFTRLCGQWLPEGSWV